MVAAGRCGAGEIATVYDIIVPVPHRGSFEIHLSGNLGPLNPDPVFPITPFPHPLIERGVGMRRNHAEVLRPGPSRTSPVSGDMVTAGPIAFEAINHKR